MNLPRSFLLSLLLACNVYAGGAGSVAYAVPPWTPLNTGKLIAWWDGFYGASGTITLLDLSGNGRTMSKSVSAQPTLVGNLANGWQGVHFTNSQYVTAAAPIVIGQSFHIFWAGRTSNPTAAQMCGDTTSNSQCAAFTAGGVMDMNDIVIIHKSTSAPTVSSFCLLEWTMAGSQPGFYANGVTQGFDGTGVMTTNFHFNALGQVINAAFLNGDMMTCFVLNVSAVAAATPTPLLQAQCQNYCRNRFKLY